MSQLTERTGSRVTSFGHWLRERFIRENLFNALKTFAWLGPLTLLIWVYAERAQVVEEDNVSIPIEVQSNDRNRFVRLDQPAPDKVVIVRLSGPRSRVDELRQQLDPRNNPSVILPIDSTLPAGQSHDLDAAQLISHSRLFESSGVSVTDSKPARIRVYIDQYQQQDVDIQAPAGSNIQGTPVFTPAKATVRAPARDLAMAINQGTLTVEADLKSTGVLDQPGTHEINVRIKSPQLAGNNSVTYTPDTVKATIEVRPTDISYEISSMNVLVQIPSSLQKDYLVSTDDFISNITVTGPSEQIAALQKETAAKPQAILTITRDDLNGDRPSHPLQVQFPAGIQNVRLSKADEAKNISFRLIKRATE
ncbi:MAG TPA: hypothetical protein VHD56_07865 [Tepidisphaeraceae bacterium]|nr:hypothetical protein [Tepidisphaeraceae bacterium]